MNNNNLIVNLNNFYANLYFKMKNKTIIIIPGFGESTKDSTYSAVKKEIKSLGYNIVFHQPKWKKNTIKKWLSDFKEFLKKFEKTNPIILGFSFGAYIAIISAKDFKFSKIILCSLSPYFKDDIKNLSAITYKILGRKRIDDFKKHDFPKNLETPTIFLVGDKDMKIVIKRSVSAYKKYKGYKKIIKIKGAEHDLNNKNYIDEIKQALSF